MHKRIIPLALLLCILIAGCSPQALTPDPVTGLYLKQINRVHKCTDEAADDYETLEAFFKISENFAIIPE